MGTILPFLKDEPAFDPTDIQAMSMALEDACKALNVQGGIIELARRGERSPTKLRDRVLAEANGGTGC